MVFHPFFDAGDSGLFAYWPVAISLAFLIAGVCCASLDGRARRSFNLPAYLRGFGALLTVVSAVLGVGTAVGLSHRQAEIRRVLAQRDFRVVEGVVADFQPGPSGGHGAERFRVGDDWFGYSGPVDTGGFHQTRADGGPITDGRRVRMAVDRRGRILKLDLGN